MQQLRRRAREQADGVLKHSDLGLRELEPGHTGERPGDDHGGTERLGEAQVLIGQLGALVESTEPSQGGAPPDASDHAERCGAVGKIAVRYADANVERLGHRQRCVEGS